jgi:hypothetical protein
MISALHDDLRPYIVDEEGIDSRVNHRLVASPLLPEEIATINEIYASKCQAIEDAAANGDWPLYIGLHERPYRFDAMEDAIVSGADILSLIREVWIDSENTWQCEDDWREYLPLDGCWQSSLMNAEEQRAFDALPDPVRVFRGYKLDGRERGLSWTTDRSVAECFAHRFADIEEGAHPRIAVGVTPKAKVVAHFLERNGERDRRLTRERRHHRGRVAIRIGAYKGVVGRST